MIENLPDGWRVEKWDNVLEIKNGKNQKAVVSKNGLYPIYGSGGVIGYANDYLCQENSVIIGRKGSINNPLFVKEKFWNVDTAFGLITDKNILLPLYLYYFSLTFDFERLNTTTTIPSLTKERLKNIIIPIPPLPQQEKIVKVLDISSSLIEKQKELIKNYDLFLKSKFIEMFGDPISNPMEWEIEKLENLGKWKGGGTPSRQDPEYFKGNIPWITTTSLGKLYIDRKNAVEFITNEAIQNSATKIIPINSIIIGTRVGVGKVSINTEELCSNQDIMSLTNITDNVIPIYIFYFIHFYKKVLKSQQRGATIQGITAPVLKQLNISIPPINLQNKFASIVEKIELIKEKENKKLKSLQTLQGSLMQKAFKGEIG